METDEKEVVSVWTDGSARSHAVEEGHAGGYAFVSTYKGRRIEVYGWLTRCTNNRAELAAIYAALTIIKPVGLDLVIYSDSQYCINAITLWRHKWERNGWTTGTGTQVANRGLIEAIAAGIDKHQGEGGNVVLRHIRGHAGHAENERADYLAGKARVGMVDKVPRGFTVPGDVL